MKLPHRIVHAARIAKLAGHDGVTVLVWTFVARRMVSERFVRHEYRHVQQWAVGTVLGGVIITALHFLTGLSLWWLLTAPLGFLLPYLVCQAAVGYSRNPFERDADRYAERGA